MYFIDAIYTSEDIASFCSDPLADRLERATAMEEEEEKQPVAETGEETAVPALTTGLNLVLTAPQIEELLKLDSVARRTAGWPVAKGSDT